MARSFHQNIAHIIFSTKNRQPLITADLESDLHSYLGGIIRKRTTSTSLRKHRRRSPMPISWPR